MKKLLFTLTLLCSIVGLKAQSISHIETTKAWYYIYDQDGKKIKTLSTSQGELKGYSSTFYIIKQGSAFLHHLRCERKTAAYLWRWQRWGDTGCQRRYVYQSQRCLDPHLEQRG